jgi:hypothetical protein
MRTRKASQAIDQDIGAAINRNYGLAILVLQWVWRVPQRFCEPGSVDVYKVCVDVVVSCHWTVENWKALTRLALTCGEELLHGTRRVGVPISATFLVCRGKKMGRYRKCPDTLV